MGEGLSPEQYDGGFWARLLTRLDDEISEPLRLIVIGGAAIGLQHIRSFQTRDLDTITAIPAPAQAALHRVLSRVQREDGLARLPEVTHTGVWDAPLEFESRCAHPLPHLRKLDVLVPERHDLVMMKTSRAEDRDLDAAHRIHRMAPLEIETLLDLYGEMQFAGPDRSFAFNFAMLLERLYGEPVGAAAHRVIVKGALPPGRTLPPEVRGELRAAMPWTRS